MPDRAKAVIDQTAADHGVTSAHIIGPGRAKGLCLARFDAASRLRALRLANGRPPSTPQIGLWLGGRDHTSILSALRRWAEIVAERGG
jgi:chromosomal replication initiation ATPase DnaA